MKNFFRFAVVLTVFGLAFVSCTKEEGDFSNMSPAEKYEAVMAQEAKDIPSFSATVSEDSSVSVPEVPESVVWLTASYPDLGSSMTKKGGTVHVPEGQYAENYRFIGPQGNHSWRSYMNPGCGLLGSSDETKEFYPMACTHWAYGADNQTVYYKLRENVKWSDGVPCTADDYVWAWKMWNDPNLEAPFYNKYGVKFEVKKITDYCIAVKWLESEHLSKYELLDHTTMSPYCKHFFDPDNIGSLKKGWYLDYNWKYSPTIGPYVMDEERTKKGELFVLKHVDNWWGYEVPYLKNIANFDFIEVKVVSGGKEIIKEYFYKGEFDVFGVTEAQYWNEAATNKNVSDGYIDRWILNFAPRTGMGGIFFNTKSDFFKNRLVRQAMYYAFDVQGTIDNVMKGEVKRAHNIGMGNVWAGYDYNDHSIRKPDFDPAKAGELLAEAGYTELGSDGIRMTKDGKRASFELLYPQSDNTERFSYMKEQAKKAGVELELKLLQQGWIPLVFAKDFEAVCFYWSFNYVPTYWQSFARELADKADSNNVTGYSSDEMEALLAIEDDDTIPTKEKAENNKKIERLVHDEALVLPLWYSDFSRAAAWKWFRVPSWGNMKFVSSLFGYDSDLFYSYSWIDEDIKNEILNSQAENKTYEPKIWKPSTRYAVVE